MATACFVSAGDRGTRRPGCLSFVSVLLALLVSAHPARGAAGGAPRVLLLDAAIAGTDIVAVGEIGSILRSSDSGLSWTATPPVTKATLTAISFVTDGRTGWAVGHDALIVTTRDGGQTWSRSWQGESLEASFLDVCALSAEHVIAIGAYGLFLETRDGGTSWTSRRIIEEDMHLNRVTRGPEGTLYIAGERGTLLRSTDQGETWAHIATPYDGSFFGILPLGPETLLAYGLRGHVFRSTDHGDTWTAVPLPQPMLIATAVRTASGEVVLAGQARGHFISGDEGVSFAAWPINFDHGIAELLVAPDGALLAFGESGASTLSDSTRSSARTPSPPVAAAEGSSE
jgi:photosystem II stability/assembly factor-like uncharacterized protein